jgi:hypothetical protein
MVLKCICFSPHFGPKLRVFALILFFPCALLYPVFVLIGSIGVGIYIAGHCAVELNLYYFVSDTKNVVVEFECFLRNSVYLFCYDMMHPPLGTEIRVYDISFRLLGLCLLASFIWFVICAVFGIFLSVAYVIPMILKAEYNLFRMLCEMGCEVIVVFIPWLIAVIIAPPLILVIAMAFPIAFAIGGLSAGVMTYQKTFETAMAEMCKMVCEFEQGIREFLFS